MPRKRPRSLRCPSCKKLVLRDDPEFPFCSARCRLVDLGRWASGKYVVSTAVTDPEAFAAQAGERRPDPNHPADPRDEPSRYRH